MALAPQPRPNRDRNLCWNIPGGVRAREHQVVPDRILQQQGCV